MTSDAALDKYIQERIAALDALKAGATARRRAELQGEIGELREMATERQHDREGKA